MYCIFEYISFDFGHMADFRIQGSQSKINIFFNCRLFGSAARSSSLCIEFEFWVSNCQTYITFDFCSSIRVLVRVTQVFSLADFDFWGLILVEYSSVLSTFQIVRQILWFYHKFIIDAFHNRKMFINQSFWTLCFMTSWGVLSVYVIFI